MVLLLVVLMAVLEDEIVTHKFSDFALELVQTVNWIFIISVK